MARQVDEALRSSGFLLVTGHRVPGEVRAQTRAAAREFFALPALVKARYAITVGGRGWIPPGAEANGYAEGTAMPPDLPAGPATGGGPPAIACCRHRPRRPMRTCSH